MASEISWRAIVTNASDYVTIRSAVGTMWNTSGSPGLENLTVANWRWYAIAMVETPSGGYLYVANWPAGLTTAGWYWLDIYNQAAGTAAISDSLLGTLLVYWDGTTAKPWADDATQVGGTGQTGRDLGATLGSAGAGLTSLGDARLANLDAAISSRSTYAGGYVAGVTGNVLGKVIGSGVSNFSGVGVQADIEEVNNQSVVATAGVDFDEIALTATRVTLALPASAPNAAGGLTVVGSAVRTNTLVKNTAFPGFQFVMLDATTHQGKAGLGAAVTAERSLGGAFGACANGVTEIGNGTYSIDLAASDLNANCVSLRFTAAGADDTIITLFPQK